MRNRLATSSLSSATIVAGGNLKNQLKGFILAALVIAMPMAPALATSSSSSSSSSSGSSGSSHSDPFSSALDHIQQVCKALPGMCPGSGSGGSGSDAQAYYYCRSPAGYYPYVRACDHWETVPSTPSSR
jgi:hypothetical protein